MTTPDRRMIWLLARAWRRTSARADAGLADIGLTSAQSGALFCFSGEAALTIGDLAGVLGLAQSAASGLARRMEEAGLVERSSDPEDGRATRLTLTDLGRRRRAEAARRAKVANERMVEGFSDREIAIVSRWLTHIADMEDDR